jgi:malonyl-CoA/methylmalonyl-CoA synthetase
MVTHGNLTSNAEALHQAWQFTPGDVLLHALPLFHVHGLFVALHTALLNASRIIFRSKYEAAEVIRALPRATVFMGVPTYYVRLLAEAAFTKELCAGMRLFVSGSAPLLLDTFEEFRRRTGHAILERYGMTETGMNTSNPYAGERRGGTVGFALPGIEVRVVDDADHPLAAGATGHIQVRGPNVMRGYWRLPEKTREEFTADGFFRTGDLLRAAVMDGRTCYIFEGRLKDNINRGGEKFGAEEVEALIVSHPAVNDARVVAMPDPMMGERACAFLILKTGQDCPTVGSLGAFLHAKGLAKFKLPERIETIAEFPLTRVGKVDKQALRRIVADRLESEAAALRNAS